MTDLKSLADDPRWLPDALDAGRRMIRFARIDRAALGKEAFLDQRKNSAVTAWAEARIDDLAPIVRQQAPPAFILHSAFCGSTLLARALDAPGKTLSLREPNILLDLANARRVVPALQQGGAFDEIAGVIANLLARPHSDRERVIIKPTNSASPAADAAAFRPSKKLYLYGSQKEFLLSLLKKGEQARAFVRLQYNVFALDRTGLGAIEPRKAMSLTDLQIAALVWRHQLEEFERRLKADGDSASIDYEAMMSDTPRALGAIARHLELPLDAEDISRAANGPVFRTNSKFAGEDFDAGVRLRENAEFEARFADELKLIADWAAPVTLGVDMRPPLARRLAL